jgi:tetratricopeptide (TPR) repeat protein
MGREKKRHKGRFRKHLFPILICAVALSISALGLLSVLRIIPISTAIISSLLPLLVGVLGFLIPSLQAHYGSHKPPSLEQSLSSASNMVTANEVAPLSTWQVPYRRNPFFVGREDMLSQMHDNLMRHSTTHEVLPQVLSGLGGIGKTQLAIEYAYRHREEYHWVFWLRADTRDSFIADITSVLELLSLAKGDEQDQHIIMFSFKHWLVMHSQWLLILDNVDDVQVVDDLLPTSKGHILLTTRVQALPFGQNIEVKEMKREEGMLFLLRRAGLLEPNASLDAVSQEDRADAQAIVDKVRGLPLALDQAGAYIREVGCSVSEYRRLFADEKRHRQELLSRRGRFPSDHPESVTSTFLLSFQRIEQANPAAADLLRFFAFLSPDTIPEELIQGGLEELGATLQKLPAEPLQINEAIVKLRNYSLVHRDRDSQAFTIHRLVQIVIRNMMDEDMRRQWAERTVRAVYRVFPDWKVSKRLLCRRLFPQAQICFELITQWEMKFPEAASLLHRAARYLRKSPQRYREAELFGLQALKIQEEVLGKEHVDVAETLYGLAVTYEYLNKYQQSESFFRRAIAIREHIFGQQAPETLRVLNSLGYMYFKQKKYDEAASLYQQSLAFGEQVPGANDKVATSTSLNNLALVYSQQEKYDEAEALYKRALEIRERVSGKQSVNAAITLKNMADLYEKQGKYEQAEPLYQQALAIFMQKYEMEDRYTARCLKGLADLYGKQGEYKQAAPLYEQALSIWREFLGLDHLEAAEVLEGYADLLRKMRRKRDAARLEAGAKAVREKVASQEESH